MSKNIQGNTRQLKFDNVADLKAFTGFAGLSTGDIANTNGYTTQDDGGQATYYWDAADSTTADDGKYIACTANGANPGRWIADFSEGVMLDAFGALSNGTDTSARLQAAIAYVDGTGQTLIAGAGKDYNISHVSIVPTTGNFSFDGNGCTLTDARFQLDDTVTDTSFYNYTHYKSDDAVYDGLGLDYQGFFYLKSQDTFIDKVNFICNQDGGVTGRRNCIWPYTGCERLTVTRCYHGPKGGSWGIAAGRDVIISHCIFDNPTTDDAIAIKAQAGENSENWTIDNCTFENAYGAVTIGSAVEENGFVRNITVTNCTCYNTAVIAEIRGGYTLTGATLSGGYISGIAISNCTQFIDDPSLDLWRAGIRFQCGFDTLIDGVKIDNCVGYVRNGATTGRGCIEFQLNSKQGHIARVRNVSIKDCLFEDVARVIESGITAGHAPDFGVFVDYDNDGGIASLENILIDNVEFNGCDRRGVTAHLDVKYDNFEVKDCKFNDCGYTDNITLAVEGSGIRYTNNEVNQKKMNYAVKDSGIAGSSFGTRGEVFRFALGDLAAGSAYQKTLDIPCKNGFYVLDCSIESASTLTFDGTNYNTYSLTKRLGHKHIGDDDGASNLEVYANREKNTLTVPTTIDVPAMDQTFIVIDSHFGTVAYWFADAFHGASDAEPTEPAHGADFGIKIPLMSTFPSVAQELRPDIADVDGHKLAYGTKTGVFTVGLTVTGGTSGATAVIDGDTDLGSDTSGTLVLTTISGTFQSGEVITDSSTGSATTTAVMDFGNERIARKLEQMIPLFSSGGHKGFYADKSTNTVVVQDLYNGTRTGLAVGSTGITNVKDKTGARDTAKANYAMGFRSGIQYTIDTATVNLTAYTPQKLFAGIAMKGYSTNKLINDEPLVLSDERLIFDRAIAGTGAAASEDDMIVDVEVIRF